MGELSNIDLFVCYDDFELLEVKPFAVGIWRFSDTGNLDDLSHLAAKGITKPMIERYGRSVLSIDLPEENNTVETRERLQHIHDAMPVSETGVCQIILDSDVGSVTVYGDNTLAAIDKLVEMSIVSEATGINLANAFREANAIDNIISPDTDAARKGAVARLQPTATDDLRVQ